MRTISSLPGLLKVGGVNTSENKLLDGKRVAQDVLDEAKRKVERLEHAKSVTPCLATVLVGGDPASATYVKMKRKRCEDVGMTSLPIELPEDTNTATLVQKISELSDDPAINGILVADLGQCFLTIDFFSFIHAVSPGGDFFETIF